MNRQIMKKLLAGSIASVLALSVLAGCNTSDGGAGAGTTTTTAAETTTAKKDETETDETDAGETEAGETETDEEEAPSDETEGSGDYNTPGEISYPIQTDETITIWADGLTLHNEYLNPEDSPFHTGLSKMTGVDIEWEWPAPGADSSQSFNILLASQEYPDIIYDNQVSQAENLINDKVIIPLNDVLPDYAPNLWAYLQANDEIDKGSKTDEGNYYMFPALREDPWLSTYAGPLVRQDWLDEQGLEAPTTLEEVEHVLRVFKDEYGARFGAIDQANRWSVALAGAYNIDRTSYYNDGGTIKFGPAEDAYKDYLTMMKRWYDDGLIDPDFATLDDNTLATKMANDEIGYTISATSQRDKWMLAAEKTDSGALFEPAPYPVLNAGDTNRFIQTTSLPGGDGAHITTSAENVELVARFLDYGYSEEGIIYWNFGEEGVAHEIVDGVPTFTEMVVNDPGGKYDALKKYVGTTANGPSIQQMGMWQQRNIPSATDAVNMWVGDIDPLEVKLPSVLTPTVEEANQQSALENAINTYSSEMFYNFIFGEESLDNFDDYVETMKSMGLEQVIGFKQAQYDRYLNR